MKTVLRLLPLFVIFATSSTRAEWKELKDQTGLPIQIVVDFKIEKLTIDAKGTASFIAKATIDGMPIGFSATMTKARQEKIDRGPTEAPLTVTRSDLDLRSIGPATAHLDHLLNERFRIPSNPDNIVHIAGPYDGTNQLGAESIAGIVLLHTWNAGLTYDEHGRLTSCLSIGLYFVIDAPLERMTVYFDHIFYFGGPSGTDRLRSEWYEARKKNKTAKQP